MCGIYKITNKITGRVYIGHSICMERRWKEHIKIAFDSNDRRYNYPLYVDMRLLGHDNFEFSIVEYCARSELGSLERFYIEKYNSRNDGYNQIDGSESRVVKNRLDWKNVEKIKQMLKNTNLTCSAIAKEFKVSLPTIIDINKGRSWVSDDDTYPIRHMPPVKKREANYCLMCGQKIQHNSTYCKKCNGKVKRKAIRPSALEIALIVKEVGFLQAGKKFGVSDNAVKKWCRGYGIPSTKKELVAWYDQQAGIAPDVKAPIQRTPMTEIVHPVKQIDKNTGRVLNIFPSIRAAARALGNENMNGGIWKACLGKRKTAYGYIWEFA